MSLRHLRNSNTAQVLLVKKIIRNGLASDAAKTSTNTASTSTASSTIASDTFQSVPDKKQSGQSTGTAANINVVVNPSSPEFVKVAGTATVTPSYDDAHTLSFDKIPGPLSLKSFAKILSYMPSIAHKFTAETVEYILSAATIYISSQLTWGSNLWLFGRMINGYGPVVRLYGPFGGNIVLLSRPEHAKIVFENEGQYPIRSWMDCVERYRLHYRKTRHCGPFLMYGPEWQKLREAVEQPMASCLANQYDKLSRISDEFISRIVTIRNRQEEVPPNFIQEINKWSLECFCSVTLNRRLGFLDPCGLSTISDPGRLLFGFEGATDAIRKCEWGVQLWRVIETPAWKSLVKNLDNVDSILSKYVSQAQDSLRKRKDATQTDNMSLLENILLKEGIIAEDAMTILLDMMLVGVNAVSNTVAFMLYHLARAPRCQVKLYNEIQSFSGDITKSTLKKMTYLQACIKETLRLKPPIPILNRKTTRDLVVHNYRIPKGTHILMPVHISSMREEHFEDALKFKPERWVSDDPTQSVKPFSLVSFGYGPKQCFAKELATTQIGLVTAKVLKRFSIEYYYSDIHSSYRMIASPTGPLKLRFTNRK